MTSLPAAATGSKPAAPCTRAHFEALALADLQQRLFYRHLPAEEQREAVADLARRIALFDAPIGQLAARISNAASDLANAFNDFAKAYPTAEAARAAGADALDSAGFNEDAPLSAECTAAYFAITPRIATGLCLALEAWFDLLNHCDTPELASATANEVSPAQVRCR